MTVIQIWIFIGFMKCHFGGPVLCFNGQTKMTFPTATVVDLLNQDGHSICSFHAVNPTSKDGKNNKCMLLSLLLFMMEPFPAVTLLFDTCRFFFIVSLIFALGRISGLCQKIGNCKALVAVEILAVSLMALRKCSVLIWMNKLEISQAHQSQHKRTF